MADNHYDKYYDDNDEEEDKDEGGYEDEYPEHKNDGDSEDGDDEDKQVCGLVENRKIVYFGLYIEGLVIGKCFTPFRVHINGTLFKKLVFRWK